MEKDDEVMNHYPLLSPDSRFPAVILADGDYPTHPIPLSVLSSSSCLVCCDGAGAKAIAHGLSPVAVVGDGDSLPMSVRDMLGDRLHIVAEQEFNDLTKATRYVMEQLGGASSIAYIAATGKREDHTLANISLMAYYERTFGLSPVMITDYGYFAVARGGNVFGTFPGQQVSIFNISCKRLCGTGLLWQPYAYTMFWEGTLNEATGDAFTIDADGVYMVYRTFDKKIM